MCYEWFHPVFIITLIIPFKVIDEWNPSRNEIFRPGRTPSLFLSSFSFSLSLGKLIYLIAHRTAILFSLCSAWEGSWPIKSTRYRTDCLDARVILFWVLCAFPNASDCITTGNNVKYSGKLLRVFQRKRKAENFWFYIRVMFLTSTYDKHVTKISVQLYDNGYIIARDNVCERLRTIVRYLFLTDKKTADYNDTF